MHSILNPAPVSFVQKNIILYLCNCIILAILPTFDRYFREMNSNTVSVSILNRYFILVKDYDFLEFILSSNKVLNKSRDYKFLGNWLNTGLLTADGNCFNIHCVYFCK